MGNEEGLQMPATDKLTGSELENSKQAFASVTYFALRFARSLRYA
jgi:hypothetical protein